MTGAEMVECGNLMAAEQSGVVLTPALKARMLELQRRAKVELPHDDLSTPHVDEGETEIARKLRIEGEWQDRLVAVEKVLCRIVETLGTQLGAVAVGALQAEVDKLLKR